LGITDGRKEFKDGKRRVGKGDDLSGGLRVGGEDEDVLGLFDILDWK